MMKMGDSMWSKIEREVFRIESIIITISLMVMFIAVVVQVAARMMGISSLGTTEIGMLTMSLITFIGTSAVTYSKDHITIELEQLIQSSRMVHWMKVITNLLMIVFGVLFMGVAYSFFIFILHAGDKTIELGIPVAIPISSMVLGLFLLIYHCICDLLRLFQKDKDVKGAS